MKRFKEFFTANHSLMQKTTLGDTRLVVIWQILNFHGLLCFLGGWTPSVRCVTFITLLGVSYTRDVIFFAAKILEGSFTIPEDAESLTFMQTEFITAYRLYLIIRFRGEFEKLVNYVIVEFPRWTAEETMRKLLDEKAKRGVWIYLMHSGQLIAVSSLLVLRPLFSHQYALVMQEPLGTLPFIPCQGSPWYQITYVFQIWRNVFSISVAFCMNMLFFTLIVRACAHLDCMAEDLEGLSADPGAVPPHKVIENVVNRYNRIREFTSLLNDLFFVLTAIQPLYTCVSVITSLLVYDGTEQSLSFAGIAIAHMLELFIYCYAGDLAAEKSRALGDRLFGCRWYELSQRDKRSVLQVVQQCQKPFNIRAGFFGNFSREMFTTSRALGDSLFGCRWYELSQRDKRSVLQVVQQCQKPFNIRAGFFGNFSREMFTTSRALGDRLVGCRWYELSQRDKRSVLQVVQQCQKPFNIRAGVFGNFSREMFTTTMKTTYSIWAVVNQAK